jgi:hypothetical protein
VDAWRRTLSLATLAAGLLIAAFFGLPRGDVSSDATRPIAALRVGDSVVTGAPWQALAADHHLRIEDHSPLIRNNDFLSASAPDTFGAPRPQAVDPATWKLVRLRAELRFDDGSLNDVNVETLQPPEWLSMHNVRVGGAAPLPLDLLEMGLPDDLGATVLAIEPCPPLAPGAGQTVLTTVNHLSDDIHELTIRDAQGNRETIRTTSGHKFYSASRTTWLAASDLQPGEHLDSLAGPLEVVSFHPYPGRHRVYNLTVQNDHVYRVSNLAALVHNNLCGRGSRGAASLEQPRNSIGQFMGKTRPGQAMPGGTAVDDFAVQAQRNGFDVIGREVSVDTPFGRRRYDLVIRDRATGAITGVEIKSSQSAFKRFDEAARQQFAADRWLRTQGGLDATGNNKGLFIEDAIKILWETL